MPTKDVRVSAAHLVTGVPVQVSRIPYWEKLPPRWEVVTGLPSGLRSFDADFITYIAMRAILLGGRLSGCIGDAIDPQPGEQG